MNSKQLYLGWVRTQHPKLYYNALVSTFGRNRGMGSLGDDLTTSITPDLVSADQLTSDITDVPVSSDVTDSVNAAYNASMASSSSSSGWFDSLANAISSLGSTVVQTQAQQNLLAINTQRARQGLPPLTANGVPVTGSMLSPTSSTVARMEAALSGGTIPLLLIGGLGLAAVLMLSKSRRS